MPCEEPPWPELPWPLCPELPWTSPLCPGAFVPESECCEFPWLLDVVVVVDAFVVVPTTHAPSLSPWRRWAATAACATVMVCCGCFVECVRWQIVTRRWPGVIAVIVLLVDDVPVRTPSSLPWLPIAAAAKPAEARSNPKSIDAVSFLMYLHLPLAGLRVRA